MDPRREPDPRNEDDARQEGPALEEQDEEQDDEEQDWEAIESVALTPDSLPENGDLRYDSARDGELSGEDDDNPYQNSDEALPEDRDEAALARDPSKEGGRFDEV